MGLSLLRSRILSDMEQWIRNKYERKIYAMEHVQEPWQLLQQGQNPRDIILKGQQNQANTNLFDFNDNATTQDIEFDAFGNNNNDWTGDFWPTQTTQIQQPAENLFANTDSENARSAKIEAAKDCIGKLYSNPAQLGFNEPSYRQTQPNSINKDTVDFTSSTIQNKLTSQDDFSEFNF
ncbi:hypothetical protein BdWA1_000114 [Babesia duncani]|uniref:Uncharacterized protein n=1 Tax=Babesia duncani TaxID=323732 RepID=A0AAD9PLY2_9APIC|nr:hypothetical protein BdWA1_000114 [Babesia duncani]